MHDAIRQNSTLSPAQAQVIAALAAGESITEAARAAGVHRSTIHNWLKEGRQFRSNSTQFDRKQWNFFATSSPARASPATIALKRFVPTCSKWLATMKPQSSITGSLLAGQQTHRNGITSLTQAAQLSDSTTSADRADPHTDRQGAEGIQQKTVDRY